jgi:two-component system chemotaxis response regulator CheY
LARKILLADDSVTAQNMGRKILADAGYEVIAVNNGSAALKKIAELKPDLVILDVYMPGYSGLEVCQRLKESQETARIPVLLTVGKLEPFKPEEAQRVRAEGYIVKPFEASELLSALSKLEDKVVPRAEPSKPGRFARAMAAADETERSGKKEPSGNETGWKSRIAFPSKKTQAEEAAEDAQSANGAENSGGDKNDKNKEKRHDSSPAEAHVDVAAFAPIGVPKDVTPSEVAAITAAAAQMQMAGSPRDDRRSSESGVSQNSEFPVEPSLERFEDSRSEQMAAAGAESSGNAAAESDQSRNGDGRESAEKLGTDKLEGSQGAPVTMAAASESAAASNGGSPRWTAVSVALESDETSISLDHEMQKAYAAFAAADYATSAGTVEAESASHDISPAPTEPITEAPITETEIAEAEITEAQITTSAEQPVAAISNSEPASVHEPVPAEANIETSRTPDLAKPEENLAPSVGPEPSMHIAAEAETPTSGRALTEAAAPNADNSEPKPDSETVKTTAAAWANWRQVRDTEPGNREEPRAQIQDPVTPESDSADTAALAVAAGAERILQDVPSAPTNGNPTDVASIVDSVLAGLRPKLMEEITRKMAEKK